MRSVKIAVDIMTKQQTPKIIGIVSTIPGEGKSTTAINLAQLLATQGTKVLLLDGDFRNPAMTHALAPHAEVGMAEAILEGVPIGGLLHVDPETGLAFIPTVLKRRIPYSSELLSSPAMDAILAAASGFDYVVIDLPPMAPVVDARAISGKVDAFVLVVEWGKTPRRVVRATLQREWMVTEKCIGVVLNKVDTRKLRLYQADAGSTYYGSRYSYFSKKS